MIDLNTLSDAIQHINGASAANLTYRAPVTLVGGKKNPQQGRVEKANTFMVQISLKDDAYGRAVENRQERADLERNFQAAGRQWGEKLEGLPLLVSKAGDISLAVQVMGCLSPVYYLDGVEVSPEVIEGLPVKNTVSNRQLDAGIPEEEQVRWQNFRIDRIQRIALAGQVLEG